MTDKERLEIICDDVRKELTQNVRSWKWPEWAQRFTAGLLARGVIAPRPTDGHEAAVRGSLTPCGCPGKGRNR